MRVSLSSRARRPLVGASAAASLVALAVAASSWASSVQYAGPNSTRTSGVCTAPATPCRLDYAISVAAAGDTVVVEPGSYSITYPVVASGAVAIVGQAGQPRPSLIGAASLTSDTLALSGGASVSGLYVEANESDGGGGAALSLDGGKADNMLLYASASDGGGAALREKDSAAGTVVTNTLARSAAPGGRAVFFTDGVSPGTAMADHVTAIGEAAGVVGVGGQMVAGNATVRNSILRGGSGAMDLSAPPPTNTINISFSNFQVANPSSYWDRGGNQSSSPRFEDAVAHDYREADGSPTIGAGQPEASDASATDPDGDPRLTANTTDIGAYQYDGADDRSYDATGSGVPASPASPSPSANGTPGLPSTLGRTVVVTPTSGTILVRRAGSHAFVSLTGATVVPVGSDLDTRAGTVTLADSVGGTGHQQVASFHGGVFRVRQSARARGRTDILLLGGDFTACARGAGLHLASISRHRPRVVRQLWGQDHGGSFQTYGRTSIATVRGTVWLTQDRCDGTLTLVQAGRVLVHDLRRHRYVMVRAGHSYLARAA